MADELILEAITQMHIGGLVDSNGHIRLTRDAILGAQDLPVLTVSIPEWGGEVFIRTMTGGERDQFEAGWKRNPTDDIRARLAVATLCDEDGRLLFSAADVPALSAKSSTALDRIFAASTAHSGLTDKDVEDLRKNF